MPGASGMSGWLIRPVDRPGRSAKPPAPARSPRTQASTPRSQAPGTRVGRIPNLTKIQGAGADGSAGRGNETGPAGDLVRNSGGPPGPLTERPDQNRSERRLSRENSSSTPSTAVLFSSASHGCLGRVGNPSCSPCT